MNFFGKLFVSFSLLGAITLSLSAGSAYLSTQKKLRHDAIDRLTAIRDNRAKIIEYYFLQKRSQVQLLAGNMEIVQAAEDFRSGFQMLEQEIQISSVSLKKMETALGQHYKEIAETYPVHRRVQKNEHDYSLQPRVLPDLTEGKILQAIYSLKSGANDMDDAEKKRFAAARYSQAHEKYHDVFRGYLNQFHFYDFFIIDDKTGTIVYSVKKEIDYGTSLSGGPYGETNLAISFSKMQMSTKPFVIFSDFEHYIPSKDHPASFFLHPIYKNNNKIGIFAAQLSIEELNDVLTGNRQWESEGLGKTGETYIVGRDGFMRSDSRFLLETIDKNLKNTKSISYEWKDLPLEKTTILHEKIDNDAFKKALDGNVGVFETIDYRGIEVISAFRPLDIYGLEWIVFAGMDNSEIFYELSKFRFYCILSILFFIVIILLFSCFMANVFSRPIRKITAEIKKFGPTSLDYRIDLFSKDEFADIAVAFNGMADSLQEKTVSIDYFDMIITSMTDILLVVDIDKNSDQKIIHDANKAACQLLEYDRNELIGLPFKKIFSNPHDGEKLLEDSLQDMMNINPVRGVEVNYITKSGKELPVLFSLAALSANTGDTPKGIVSIAQEISELKCARLRMEEQIRLLSLSIEIGVEFTKKSGLQEMLYRCCELLVNHLQLSFARIWLIDDRDHSLRIQASFRLHADAECDKVCNFIYNDNEINRIVSSGKPLIINNDCDDNHLPCHCQKNLKKEHLNIFAGYPLSVEDKVIGVLAISSEKNLSDMAVGSLMGMAGEISLGVHRKMTESSLIKSQKLHTEAQKIAQLGHWEMNIQTKELRWSDELFHIFEIGAKNDGLLSYDFFLEKIHPDDKEYVNKMYLESISRKIKYDIIHRIILKDGRIKYLHEKCKTEFHEDGTPFRSIGTTQDITLLKQTELEKKEAEERFRQAQKMEAIGTLAGGIAHDFNNMLNAIIGYSDILLMELPQNSEVYQYALQINQAGNRSTRLVQQILTFSRRSEEERQPIQLYLIVKEALKLLRSSLPTTIEIHQDIDECGFIVADSTQMHQVIMNLCTNSFHAMKEKKGVLEVKLKEMDVDQQTELQAGELSDGKYLCLTVSDTGYGIDKLTIDRIFEPYFTTKKKGEGTGLGLSTVHGIVLSHGGGISVQSEVGQGTTFRIFFPMAEIAPVLPEQKKQAEPLLKVNARILFVDDVAFNVQLGTHVCERIGCKTKGVTSSLEALAIFRDNPEDFDIVITDQTMPNLTGFELAIEILKIRSDMPIIMVTGHSDLVDQKKSREVGIKEFIKKPLDKAILYEAINNALSIKQ